MSYYKDRIGMDERPVTAELMLTNYCNYDCSYCRYKKGDKSIGLDDVKRVVGRCKELGVKGYVLSGGGEPLLAKEANSILKWMDEEGLLYGINTNLTRVMKTNASWIKVSMHENFDKKRVLENIAWSKRENPGRLGIQFVIRKKEEIKDAYEKYKGLEVDYISFRPIECVERIYTWEGIEGIRTELRRMRKEDGRIILHYKWDMMEKRSEKCWANWSVITIDWDMNVWYCCHRPDVIVGCILDNDILEKKRNMVIDMKKCDVPCRMTDHNTFLENYVPEKDRCFL